MKSFLMLFIFCLILFSACKKEKTCPNVEGEWLLSEIWIDNIKTVINDTSAISETLIISSNNTFISSSTKTGKIWNTGLFDCSKVFDVDSISFKKGSKAYFNLYIKQ